VIGRIAILAGSAVLLAGAPAARGEPAVAVRAERAGGVVTVRAEAVIEAPAALVWQVISDYERLPQFVPGIRRSAVVLRDGSRVLLEQSGEASFLLFSVPIEVRLEVEEAPPDTISSRAVAGNLRRMSGRYEIRPGPQPGTVLLLYSGLIEPGFDLPPVFGMAALQWNVEAQFEAMVHEIVRRAARR
jgi:uncharacterized membrane protein